MRRAVWAVLVAVLLPSSTSGQTIVAQVRDADSGAAVAGALAELLDAADRVIRRTLTDERGTARFAAVSAGVYRLRAEMIGMSGARSPELSVSVGETVSETLILTTSPIVLEGLRVEAESGRCQMAGATQGALVSRLWDEARKALSAASLTAESGRYRYETIRYVREIERGSGVVVKEERGTRDGYMTTPYESHPVESLMRDGFVQRRGDERLFMAPDADVLLSEAFLAGHCFHLAPSPEAGGLVGLAFRPVGDDKSVADISGSLWIDPSNAVLERLDYVYEFLEPEETAPEIGGQVNFRRMPDGSWIVPEWWIRMPVMAVQPDSRGQSRRFITRFRETRGVVLDVRETGRTVAGIEGMGGVEGIVLDSLGRARTGVEVRVVGSNQTVFSDGLGSYSITGLLTGTYRIEVRAPELRLVGYDPQPVEFRVEPGQISSLDLEVPSRSAALVDLCADQPPEFDWVVLAGSVMDARGHPASGATVHVGWNEFDFRGIDRGRQARDLRELPNELSRTTGPEGTYLFCSVPARSRLWLSATSDEMESEEFEFVVPEGEAGDIRHLRLRSVR